MCSAKSLVVYIGKYVQEQHVNCMLGSNSLSDQLSPSIVILYHTVEITKGPGQRSPISLSALLATCGSKIIKLVELTDRPQHLKHKAHIASVERRGEVAESCLVGS